MKPKLSILAATALLAFGAVGSVNALTLFAGDYKIIFDNYDTGTVYTTAPNASVCGSLGPGSANLTNIAACDSAAVSPGLSGSSTDSAGIFSIAAVTNLSGAQTLYTRGTTSVINGVTFGPYLTGVFSGIKDYFVFNDLLGQTTALATGGSLAIYNNASDYNILNGPGSYLDLLQYSSITDTGSLFLQGNFAAGAAFAGQEASYVSDFSGATLAGSGSGFLDFTGGTALSLFNTNSTNNNNGGKNDAQLSVTYNAQFPGGVSNGWLVYSSGQVSGTIQRVPEPGTLALVAVALFGLGVAARRGNRAG